MIAVDSNILIYAHRTESKFHARAAERLRELAGSDMAWAIPWPCAHEFLSIATNLRIYSPPTPIENAVEFFEALLEAPGLSFLAETDSHWSELRTLVISGRTTGGMVHDARIAAIYLQHGVSELWSADRDFGRFPTLKVVNPLVAP